MYRYMYRPIYSYVYVIDIIMLLLCMLYYATVTQYVYTVLLFNVDKWIYPIQGGPDNDAIL